MSTIENTEAKPEGIQEFTLRLRRYDPESGRAPYYEEFQIELEPHRSVLDGILQAKAKEDGSIGVRCSCRAAICGSCGTRINDKPGLACHTHLDEALKRSKDGKITIEPLGNMPVIKDLIVDMDAVHWKKQARVTPWLLPKEPLPEREHIVPRESMVDVTQTMACIQCGACVSDCLSMEIDPLFVGPAALAKAYRFVGDPRDSRHQERLSNLAEDPHGIYACTHCFKCIDACPKGVAPMSQIMRLRRIASQDHHINDRNNGERHEMAIVNSVKKYGTLNEAKMVPDSYGGPLAPAAAKELVASLPVITKALLRRKVTPKSALFHHKNPDQAQIKRIYQEVQGRDQRLELNLYITQPDEDPEEAAAHAAHVAEAAARDAAEKSATNDTEAGA
ncbi:succinate dehydrogenase/fumarate reductase iron-sulfur subunit [Patulibacter defluvii]|uniref:succinate dehydrogenase/fumarate reductase iron-sulfur subunit n=1 Tax=Patulibacter defluvii TaxID=3095358 RepID=UPI002A752CB8|nr:succinate dehydrogenase/fumarate reductase iron-sulfur subunit [Patulibacter sp. DM4]